MAKVIILGSSHSIPDEYHENTHLVIVGNQRTILIDCVSNPLIRLQKAGVQVDQITDMVLTHFHPDHVSGVPLLLMDMWLLGRTAPLEIHGLDYTLDRVEDMMGLYEWKKWPNFFPVRFHRLPERNLTQIVETAEVRLLSSPVKHLIPTIGLRIDLVDIGRSVAYSCDTEPSPAVVELAKGVDILLHEATGATEGHSSPAQAGEIARLAQARALYLIHYPPGAEKNGLLEEARQNFGGTVRLANDFMELEF